MNITELFIRRPVATTLLTLGIALTGVASYFQLPVSSLPAVDLPTIQVQANLPGASPAVMATSVATPLERHLGQIADVSEMTSSSSTGQTQIIMQFGLSRDVNGAARDVQAAINAARPDLPATLRSNPTYRKFNPADAPILIMSLTSPTLSKGQMYDAAATILQQKLSQVQGVGDVSLGGGANPGVRVELNPGALFKYGVSPEDVRAAIASANANAPKGFVSDGERRWQIYTNDQARTAADYRSLVIAMRDGQALRLSDVADVVDGVEDVRNMGLVDGKPAIVVRITRQPGANVIATVDRIKAELPHLRAQLPPQVDLEIGVDRTTSTRSSLRDVETSLGISILLVVLVVLVFLRNGRAVIIPAVAVVVSLLGALSVMYLLHYSLDTLSLMSLTVATGFVVDDAIVVLENITRHVEAGTPRFQAALIGAQEVSFTVISISISLIAVFAPIVLMGGIIGKFFVEFGVTLSASIIISLVVSLTFTPMMAARLGSFTQPSGEGRPAGVLSRISLGLERGLDGLSWLYGRSLAWALDHRRVMMAVFVVVIGLNFYLFVQVPKGLFPQQDSGQLVGGMQVDQASSFDLTSEKFIRLQKIVSSDPAVLHAVGFTGGGGGFMFASLKPKAERGGLTSDQVAQRIRPKLMRVPGASLFLQVQQEFRLGGRQSAAQYQYTLRSDDIGLLRDWSEKLLNQLKRSPILTDVNSDQQEHGLELFVNLDRDAGARLGVTAQQLDNVLYDLYGQRQVSTIYNPLNQYHVVMEAEPKFTRFADSLSDVWLPPVSQTAATALSPAQSARLTSPAKLSQPVNPASGRPNGPASTVFSRDPAPAPYISLSRPATPGPGGGASASASTASTTASSSAAGVSGSTTALAGAGASRTTTGATAAQTGSALSTSAQRMIPLAALSSWGPNNTPVSVSHQGQTVAATISFNLVPGKSLSDAQAELASAKAIIGMPNAVQGSFQGTAAAFQDSGTSGPMLILGALLAVYMVLGILYESYVHPITVLSTLPSAGVGAVLALMMFHVEFSIIALIGVILLIGIVKKNAILIIDFALQAERAGATPMEAIYQASMLRFRPILMTTVAAILGALPLALSFGEGGEMRQPLGLSIIGGLIASQLLTLLTTPVVYIYMDKLRRLRLFRRRPRPTGAPLSPLTEQGSTT